MIYNEQQINNLFICYDEQQDLNQIHWMSPKNKLTTPRKERQSQISQWISQRQENIISKRKNPLSYLIGHKQEQNRTSYLLGFVYKQKETNIMKHFSHTPQSKRSVCKGATPNKINIRLPLPNSFHQTHINMPLVQREASLPMITKLLKKSKRSLQRQKQQFNQLLQQGNNFKEMNQINSKGSSNKRKIIGCARRQIKSLQSCKQKTRIKDDDTLKLKECMTFIK